jgi:hypothetical protein
MWLERNSIPDSFSFDFVMLDAVKELGGHHVAVVGCNAPQ